LVGYDGADTLEGGGGEDRFKFFPGPFSPSSPLATPDIVLDFEGAGTPGGDQIDLAFGDFLVFRGNVCVDPVAGAKLSGGGNGLTDLFYTGKNGNTWLLADQNDNGVLDATDFAVQFSGAHTFTEADFTARTNFVIAGTNKSDTIYGTDDDDIIFGLDKNDKLFGQAGDDELHGGNGNDRLDGGTGFDTLYGDAGNDTLTLATSDVGGNAYGGEGDDLLIGNDAQFTFSWLEGGSGNDTLQAGAGGATMVDFDGGDDKLVGETGDDSFTGGAGNDKFVFGSTWTSSSGFQDIIWDFEDGLEKIDLRGSGLTFADLTIDNSGYSAIITSAAGQIELVGLGQQGSGTITQADFLFA
jgi:Ca2+-binding RTX toxin-like protein